jgi:hypothetical protein
VMTTVVSVSFIIKINPLLIHIPPFRFCMEHVRANMMASVPKKKGIYGLCWAVSTALDEAQYMKAWTDLIQTSDRAAAYLQRIPLEKWTLFQDGFYRWGEADVESSETERRLPAGREGPASSTG